MGVRATAEGEAGFVTAEWAVGVAVLVIPVLLLLGVLPSWATQREAAGAAAREAARVAAASPADGPGPAVAAASAVLAGRGLDPTVAVIAIELPPDDPRDARPRDARPREGTVVATVWLPGRTATVPLLGGVAGPPATATHVRYLDPHRSGP